MNAANTEHTRACVLHTAMGMKAINMNADEWDQANIAMEKNEWMNGDVHLHWTRNRCKGIKGRAKLWKESGENDINLNYEIIKQKMKAHRG